jgi:hypothetical protein
MNITNRILNKLEFLPGYDLIKAVKTFKCLDNRQGNSSARSQRPQNKAKMMRDINYIHTGTKAS